jgi:hypothetical protein
MLVEYKRAGALDGGEQWIVHAEGKTDFYKRVCCGLVRPTDNEPSAVILIMGEKYQYESEGAPSELVALRARVGDWPDIEQGLGEFRKQWKFTTLVTEPVDEEENAFLRKNSGLRYGSDTIPLAIAAAPKQSVTEIARQRVNGLIEQGRLNVDTVKNELDQAASQGALALQCLITWMLEHPAQYKKPTPPMMPPSAMSA